MLVVLIISILVYGFQVVAHPTLIQTTPPSSPIGYVVPCASVETYTVEWFLDEASKRTNIDLPLDNALFYTRGMTRQAKDYACEHDLITIWSIWNESLYNFSDVPSNSMRCIHNDETKRRRFFESMSKAYARLATGTAVVMHGAGDWANPPEDGIWHRVEYKTMVHDMKTVTTILKLKEKDSASALVLWDRELPPPLVFEKPISVVLAAGRHVPPCLGRAIDWIAGSVESAKQGVLDREHHTKAHRGKIACDRVPTYPFEVY
ncbi:hypothetical protein SVAN01_11385 [Stagonosporopsis vannaccii]|nr:hypothetical protein SVAN01_11385 [Stagonosporopsis vannaccii]